MALTEEQIDRECLESETAYLSGMMLVAWGEPEMLTRYATRGAVICAALGDARGSKYHLDVANGAALLIGMKAQRAWSKRAIRHRIFAGAETRHRWERAYTESLFADADDQLRRAAGFVAELRQLIVENAED